MNFKRFHESKNLFDKYAEHTVGQTSYVYTISGLTPNQKYTCSTNFVAETGKEAAIYFNGSSTGKNGVDYRTPKTFTCDSSGTMDVYVRFQPTTQSNPAIYNDLMNGTIWIMVNEGSTPQPYEPYSSEVWHDVPYYQHKTATDTLTLPAVIYPNDTSITLGIKGNTVQSGTPTPDNPVMPQGTGERTGNLYNINAHDVNNGYVNNAQLSQDGTTKTWGSAEISEYIPINGDTAYTFNGIGSYNSPCYALYDENKQLIGAYKYSGRNTINFISPNNARYFRFTHIKTATQAMTVEGTYISSTMPEFEPYGYKIPISSAEQTTPVYLGEVESTRRIKKLVLTGEENLNTDTYLRFSIYINDIKISTSRTGRSYCSHYECLYHAEPYDNDWNNVYYQSGATLYFHDRRFSTVADFKSYLATQYASGTPVTVWYVLATEETAVVNEPLMKIGTYADEVSGISIPTTAGANTLSIGTALQPSEVTINYKGWHPVQSVHEAENGAWT